jgi:outer membrane protein TolC
MKILVVLFMLTTSLAIAQQIDFKTIILPSGASNIDFSEKLVRLAWQNNPGVEVLRNEYDKSTLEVKYSKWNWLENFRVTGNLNEFNIHKSDALSGSQFFPRYNISASISMGTLFTNPIKTKIEKGNLSISSNNINQAKLAIRSEVLRKYQTYLSNKEINDLRIQMLEDSFSDYKLKEQSFSRGEITLVEYTFSLDRYNQQKISKIQSEKDLQISILELEELIGIKLSDVQ